MDQRSLLVQVLLFFNLSHGLEICKTGEIHRNCIPHNCTKDSECHRGSPGPYSRCRREFARCECFHRNRIGVAVNSTCLPVKGEGEVCRNDLECRIGGTSECVGASGNSVGICGCAFGSFYHEERNECLKLHKMEGYVCHEEIQCSDLRALGALAICDKESRTCKCWDTLNEGIGKTGWHDGKCHYVRGEGETCNYREECVLGFHPNADCIQHESYRNETVCTCPEGERCDEETRSSESHGGSTPVAKIQLILFHTLLFANIFHFLTFNSV